MEIVTHAEVITICGLEVELTRSQQVNYGIIQNHWKFFNRELKYRGLSQQGTHWKKFAVTYKKNDTFYYLTAVPFVADVPAFISMDIPVGEYARFEHTGHSQGIKKSLYEIYTRHIPEASITLDLNRTFIHYELYDSRFNWNNASSIIDICVPFLSKSDLKRRNLITILGLLDF